MNLKFHEDDYFGHLISTNLSHDIVSFLSDTFSVDTGSNWRTVLFNAWNSRFCKDSHLLELHILYCSGYLGIFWLIFILFMKVLPGFLHNIGSTRVQNTEFSSECVAQAWKFTQVLKISVGCRQPLAVCNVVMCTFFLKYLRWILY